MNSLIFVFTILFYVASAVNKCKPSQIHIALSDAFTYQPLSNSPIRAVFHTDETCNSAYIEIKTPQGVLKVAATTVEYFTQTYDRLKYQTYIHVFDFPALAFDQAYQYTCYPDDSGKDAVGPFDFYVPNPVPNGRVNRVVMFGDHDSTLFGTKTINYLTSLKQSNFTEIQAYIHLGDLAYDLEYLGGRHGDGYMNSIQDFAASMPLMVTLGNHENFQNFSNANMRLRMPRFSDFQNHYYSFNIGNMHFVTVNLDLPLLYPDLLAPMLNWLSADLQTATASRAEVPWIIFYTHRPLYCSDNTTSDCEKNAQKFAQLESILNQYGVDLFVSGHVHAYERMLPIIHGEVADYEKVSGDNDYRYFINPTAPIYVVQGKSGHLGDFDTQKPYAGKPYTVTVDMNYSAMTVHALNNTHLHCENVYTKKGGVHDDFYIIKNKKNGSGSEQVIL